MRRPKLGDSVHFMFGNICYAAMITAVSSRLRSGNGIDIEGQTLVVFPPMDQSFTTVAVHDEEHHAPSTWHFPEQEKLWGNAVDVRYQEL